METHRKVVNDVSELHPHACPYRLCGYERGDCSEERWRPCIRLGVELTSLKSSNRSSQVKGTITGFLLPPQKKTRLSFSERARVGQEGLIIRA